MFRMLATEKPQASYLARTAEKFGLYNSSSIYKELSSNDTDRILKELNSLSAPSDTARREAFFYRSRTEGRVENKPAATLLKSLILHQDDRISQLAMTVLHEHLENAGFAARLSKGTKAENPSACSKAATYHLIQYFREPEKTDEHLKGLALNLGYIYSESGDDNVSDLTSHRLKGFFEKLKSIPSLSILYDLVHSAPAQFLEDNADIVKNINRNTWATNDADISLSLTEKAKKTSYIQANGGVRLSYWSQWEPIKVANSAAEKQFLISLGIDCIGDDEEKVSKFKLDFNEVVSALHATGGDQVHKQLPYTRDEILERITTGYFLMEFRQRTLEEEFKAGIIDEATRKLKVNGIKEQIKRLETVLTQENVLDTGAIGERLRDYLNQRSPDAFLFSLQGAMAVNTAILDPAATKVLDKVKHEYGAAAPTISSPGIKGLRELDKALGKQKSELATAVSDQLVSLIDPAQSFLKVEMLEQFNRVLQLWSPDTSDLQSITNGSPAALAARGQRTLQVAQGLPAVPMFDLEKASTAFKDYLKATALTDNSAKYVLDNWDKIFKVKLDALDLGNDYTLVTQVDRDSIRNFVLAKLKLHNKYEQSGSDLELRLSDRDNSKSISYADAISQILRNGGDAATGVEKTCRRVLDEEFEASKSVYDRKLSMQVSSIESMLEARNADGSGDAKLRLVGVMALAARIQRYSKLSDHAKDSAIDHIGLNVLKLERSQMPAFLNAVTDSSLNRASSSTIEQIMNANKTAVVQDAASLMQHIVMDIDIVENGINKFNNDITVNNQKMIEGFIKMLYKSGDHEALAQVMSRMADSCNEERFMSLQSAYQSWKTADPVNPVEKDERLLAFTTELAGCLGNEGLAKFFKDKGILADEDSLNMAFSYLFEDNEHGYSIIQSLIKIWQDMVKLFKAGESPLKVLQSPPQDFRIAA